MFRGATKVTLDAKGRFAIPSKYRERIMTRADGHLVVTVDQHGCLLIYPLPTWEEVEKQIVDLPTEHPRARWTQRFTLGYATELDLDGHGRILLTRELREFAGIERTAMLAGQGKKFELWDEERWRADESKWLAAGPSETSEPPPELAKLSL